MPLSRRFAPSTAIASLLAIAVLYGLTACSKPLARPESVPLPPEVACDLDVHAIPAIPEIPGLDAIGIWAGEMIGIYEIAIVRILATNDCLADLRAKKVIR